MHEGSGAPGTDASLLSTVEVDSNHRVVNGVRLHTVTAGAEDGPLVVLLHGFPEFWYGWRHQIEPLVDAGYRVLVPDQRGYNLSEKPRTVRAYRRRDLARDVVDLVAAEDRESAHVVGHDWGGGVCWDLALRYPDVVDRVGVVNMPHPTAYRHQLRSNPEQLLRSWYAVSFQIPRVPELVLQASDFALLERGLRETSAQGTFSDEALARYRRAWNREGALTGMLNWYRASARYPPEYGRDRVTAPTIVVWGEDDEALVPALATASRRYCDDGRLELLPETSHWVPSERPDELTDLLLDHLADAD
ncbi:alpha/beta fold hydrolase [Halosolutus gelatinilyticus]|uniref:alpha/beta fold hydrolase n=1 Tax=Halosolutus gelatinilyticus TaxID=2931975 RepID=UPI001FF4221C|nr:alpha/beta hydrolase [Halosolutus gelatinilyticus]